jgi:hypothetical protein
MVSFGETVGRYYWEKPAEEMIRKKRTCCALGTTVDGITLPLFLFA